MTNMAKVNRLVDELKEAVEDRNELRALNLLDRGNATDGEIVEATSEALRRAYISEDPEDEDAAVVLLDAVTDRVLNEQGKDGKVVPRTPNEVHETEQGSKRWTRLGRMLRGSPED